MWCGEELVTKHRRIQRGFLMSVDRDAATEPRKTRLSTIRERNFGAAHGFTHEVPHAGSKRWQRADTSPLEFEVEMTAVSAGATRPRHATFVRMFQPEDLKQRRANPVNQGNAGLHITDPDAYPVQIIGNT